MTRPAPVLRPAARCHRARRHAGGFTLVETLVALAIAATVLGGFYNALSTGSLLGRRADDQAARVLAAMTVLDRVGVDIPLRIGTVETGTTGTLTWELVIGETPPPDMQLGPIFPGELIFVSVRVTDSDGSAPPVVLRAIRYAEAPI
jgi:prepilin-type N-terminal cleavage/methylation domain-containing protein